MPEAVARDVCIDALGLDFRGWTDDLAVSGLSAVHVSTTVVWDLSAGWMGHTSALQAITHDTMDVKRRLRESAAHMFHVDGPAQLDLLGADDRVGVILGLQDLTGVEWDARLPELLRELGIRVVQPVYNYANAYADGYMEARDAGLSRAGRQLVAALNEVGISIDVSHVGERSTLDIIEASTVPVAATHVNRRAVYDAPRNKSDHVLREIADAGGVVGVLALGAGIWNGDPNHFPTMQDVVDHVVSMVELLGEDAVGIGTDHMLSQDSDDDPGPGWWRGGPPTTAMIDKPGGFGAYLQAFHRDFPQREMTVANNWPRGFETMAEWSSLPRLLRDAGLADEVARKVLGGNWVRFFRETWSA
ncbi:membrane dipeptidase [Conexibacter stalactiti]|uniref:Membrane dipeptidase n=1 Tax=Conexibacter stalactiti TaxID=1940611 RepID=A0ABU4HWC3_9ACTN|nr:membrane dipeptidase [Conexibacter stalactiti]MDW5597625.1 membrane dipeptidase [Conexibacter stalactiti]MEC5038267.1 membrane dipeptidase [Conexibacter stalactiti]